MTAGLAAEELAQIEVHLADAGRSRAVERLLVRSSGPVFDPAWAVSEVGLEDLVLAYMRQASGRAPRTSHRHLEVQK